jgi:hypothetical protein
MCKEKFDLLIQFFRCTVGLSDGSIPDNLTVGRYANSYAISTGYFDYGIWLEDFELQYDEMPEGTFEPDWRSDRTTLYGCGLVLDPEDKLFIFFTVNGRLVGELALEILGINKKIDAHVIFLIN